MTADYLLLIASIDSRIVWRRIASDTTRYISKRATEHSSILCAMG